MPPSATERYLIRQLILLVDWLEEQFHEVQVSLRKQLESPGDLAAAGNAEKCTAFTRSVGTVKRAATSRERKRRGISAAKFDLRFSSQVQP